jgi:hypothetical protein
MIEDDYDNASYDRHAISTIVVVVVVVVAADADVVAASTLAAVAGVIVVVGIAIVSKPRCATIVVL